MTAKRPQLIQVKRMTRGAATDSARAPDVGSGIELSWEGGEQSFLSSKILRRHCPCATCQEKRGDTSHQAPLNPVRPGKSMLRVIDATADEAENLVKVWGVGNYALGFVWGDKHDSGIFSYDLLYRLTHEEAAGS